MRDDFFDDFDDHFKAMRKTVEEERRHLWTALKWFGLGVFAFLLGALFVAWAIWGTP